MILVSRNIDLPEHVAIVMDGNGRWAQKHGLSRTEGHRAGIEAVKAVIRSCLNHHIPILSLFAFSSENWQRPKEEVSALMALFYETLTQEVEELVTNHVQLRFTGDRTKLHAELQSLMQMAEEKTESKNALILNICINYGGHWDITRAVKLIAEKIEQGVIDSQAVTSELIQTHLATSPLPDPDLLIRTSGERRISNYFLWQLAYSELYFTDILWPEFDEIAFEEALSCFKKRERRFGLINTQPKREVNV